MLDLPFTRLLLREGKHHTELVCHCFSLLSFSDEFVLVTYGYLLLLVIRIIVIGIIVIVSFGAKPMGIRPK